MLFFLLWRFPRFCWLSLSVCLLFSFSPRDVCSLLFDFLCCGCVFWCMRFLVCFLFWMFLLFCFTFLCLIGVVLFFLVCVLYVFVVFSVNVLCVFMFVSGVLFFLLSAFRGAPSCF